MNHSGPSRHFDRRRKRRFQVELVVFGEGHLKPLTRLDFNRDAPADRLSFDLSDLGHEPFISVRCNRTHALARVRRRYKQIDFVPGYFLEDRVPTHGQCR